jgi:hypothetical protein
MNIYSKLGSIGVPYFDCLVKEEGGTFIIEKWNVQRCGPEPTAEKLFEVYLEYKAYYADHAIKRRREYPPIEDYIDGIVKGDSLQVQEYIDKCLAIKQKYPKDLN